MLGCIQRSLIGAIACLCTVCLASSAAAVTYDDFPPDLQQILDERIAELAANGGICIAGRVTFSDGAPISGGTDVQVNLYHGIDAPHRVYDGGWFIGRIHSSYYAGSDIGLILRAFSYDPIDTTVSILDGEVTYLEFEMTKTPPEELASVHGVVVDENGEPFYDALVRIDFPFANLGSDADGVQFPLMQVRTPSTGEYSFSGLSDAEYSLIALSNGYAYHTARFTPPVGGAATEDRQLYPNRRIVIDYAYQADGTRDFAGGALETGTISWLNSHQGVDFSQGRLEGYDSGDLRDLEMRQDRDVLMFRIFYANGAGNGFYDAGAVELDAVLAADATGYSTGARPCVVGHVYVVRTYENHYAKFLVASDESSFRTVVPGDPDPIELAGYDLTIDFTYSSGFSQVYVDKFYAGPPSIEMPSLSAYWDLSGMAGTTFSADLTFGYSEADLIDSRMMENGVTLYRSHNGGFNWYEWPTILDPDLNTMVAEDVASLGWFAIADPSHRLPGDMDGDGDLDLEDIKRFQGCFTGSGARVRHQQCIPAMLDADSDIDRTDFSVFSRCLTSPGSPIDPNCAD